MHHSVSARNDLGETPLHHRFTLPDRKIEDNRRPGIEVTYEKIRARFTRCGAWLSGEPNEIHACPVSGQSDAAAVLRWRSDCDRASSKPCSFILNSIASYTGILRSEKPSVDGHKTSTYQVNRPRSRFHGLCRYGANLPIVNPRGLASRDGRGNRTEGDRNGLPPGLVDARVPPGVMARPILRTPM
ncbi:hypothetical protein BDB13_6201 [Rhodococcus sp. OK302]|nr:hypothetical protein BDB13_6201 [Rhodococcus sp. OK302]